MDKNNLMDFVSVISFVIVLVFLFFALFLLTVKTNNSTRNRLLAAFLIVTAIDISAFFYYRYLSLPPEMEMLRVRCLPFLKSPLLFLYVLSLIYTDFRLKPKYLIHALPFLLSVIVLLPGFFTASAATQDYFFQHYNETGEIKFLNALLHIQSIGYIIANVMMLRKYKTLLFENYASNVSLSNYKWLYQLVTVIIILNIVTQTKDFFKLTDYTDITNGLTVVMLLAGLGFIFWIVLNALYYPDLFRGIDAKLRPVEKLVAEAGNISNSSISKEDAEKIQRLKDYMLQNEPYLEPSLTIQELSNQMNMPVRDLSILINHQLGQHFFDFVNQYRIHKAMRILKDTGKRELTILEILYEVGFSSKSSFNTAFKKQTDLTPTQYRNRSL